MVNPEQKDGSLGVPEIITRVCGHPQEFTPKGDRYDEARRAKVRGNRCAACGQAANEEHNRQARANQGIKLRGNEVKLLPMGVRLTMHREKEGAWAGEIRHGVLVFEGTANGVMGLVKNLAKKLLAAEAKRTK